MSGNADPSKWGFQCKQFDAELPQPTPGRGKPRQYCSARCKCAAQEQLRKGIKSARTDYHRIYQQQRRAAAKAAKTTYIEATFVSP